PGSRVGHPLTPSEFVELFYGDVQTFWDFPQALICLAKAFQDPRAEMPKHPRVRLYLSHLSRHPDPAVRQAFAPWHSHNAPLLWKVERVRQRLGQVVPMLQALPGRVVRRLQRMRRAG